MSEHKCKGTCKTKFDDKAKKPAAPSNDEKAPEQQKAKCCGNCKPKP